ncbi:MULTISPECIES: signal peptidase I [unclassified Rhodococcus (in: high G+C Gram-positive bacteria)]|uniref:signal peptidase I n=1 Tax=unclassified Rhodococcus (in: high G+C Gram-positive bacteria) TaxID=192944 RepID=UPI00278A1304|nr:MULTISPECIES: signal peptidase I [unclassified Rhodococcus (in: high G+C Gram-positive bacteria)]MDQ1179083.1 signal peptidase [Rhodococcus sp. SORGH_AS_0301]
MTTHEDATERRTGPLWWIGTVLSWVLLIGVVGVLLAAVVVPKVAGAQPYTILTQSMEPTYPPGTLVVVKPSEQLSVGSSITYQIRSGEPDVVTHRIIATGLDKDGARVYTTQGDNNPQPDPDVVQPGQIRGAVWYAIPYLGYVNNWLTGQTRTLVVGAGAALLFLYAAAQFVSAARDRRRTGRHAS